MMKGNVNEIIWMDVEGDLADIFSNSSVHVHALFLTCFIVSTFCYTTFLYYLFNLSSVQFKMLQSQF